MEHLLATIIDSIAEGVIAIDRNGLITHLNQAASRIMGVSAREAIGQLAVERIPNSRLHIVLETGIPELDQEQIISDRVRIITNRMPVFDDKHEVIGAVCFFRDITEVVTLTDRNTALKKMRSLLEAVIDSSQDAISVVDEKGFGIIINRAYTRLSGLSAEDVLGKPADEDIAEGESVHMQVLKTREPVKGAILKVGPQKKNVLVNAAPILVDQDLKGSVAIIHDISELKRLTEELTRARRIIRGLEAKYSFRDIIGESSSILEAVHAAQKAARVPATVLLQGESGTGKELFAHAIHHASKRSRKRFIRINCAAIVDSLFESELFGYEEGAFTGARRGGKKGLFEEANGGTIFFDEVSELTQNTQAKLLRVLQEKEIVRVGGAKPIPINVRIIAATHENLEQRVAEGLFRGDLYYRLNVMPIVIPPLRQRRGDIEVLARHIIHKLNQDFGRNIVAIDPKAMEVLERHPWSGNVRELENVLAQGIIKMQFNESVIFAEHLPDFTCQAQPAPRPSSSARDSLAPARDNNGPTGDLRSVLDRVEKQYLLQVLAETRDNRTEAARRLGISIRNLYNKLDKHGIGRSM